MQFLENQFLSLYRIDLNGYCSIIRELINAGPAAYKKLAFCALSNQNKGRICEHDLFRLMEHFKQRETYFFFKEIMSMPMPRDFQHFVDFDDKVFFDAYADDIKQLSAGLRLRRELETQETSLLDQEFE